MSLSIQVRQNNVLCVLNAIYFGFLLFWYQNLSFISMKTDSALGPDGDSGDGNKTGKVLLHCAVMYVSITLLWVSLCLILFSSFFFVCDSWPLDSRRT
jgi:hypothetical protein